MIPSSVLPHSNSTVAQPHDGRAGLANRPPVNGEARNHSDIVEIPLTQGYVTIIDRADEWILDRKWSAFVSSPKHVYAVSSRNERMQRLIMGAACDGLVVDHIDGDTLNNRRSNLRAVTHRENTWNVIGPSSRNVCGVRGVYRKDGGWYAEISIDGKAVYLGRYRTIDEAAKVRAIAEISAWGIQPRRGDIVQQHSGLDVNPVRCKDVIASRTKAEPLPHPGYSGVRGVRWHVGHQRWRVTLGVSAKRHYLGEFKSLEDAIRARSEAEIRLLSTRAP